jgi:hypothetical protein
MGSSVVVTPSIPPRFAVPEPVRCDLPVNPPVRDTPGLHGCRDCGKLDEFNILNGVPCCVPFESLPGSA